MEFADNCYNLAETDTNHNLYHNLHIRILFFDLRLTPSEEKPTAPEASQNSQKKQSMEAEAVAQAFIKTIPVISVNAPQISPDATNKATPVQPENAPATKADTLKPLGEQELNLSKIISELDKADK